MTGLQTNASAGWREASLPICRVCGRLELAKFGVFDGAAYWHCDGCEAILVDESCLPTPSDERAHYEWHENDTNDPRYRDFVSRLADPLLGRLEPGSEGLDYGCGPGPVLAAILREHGHSVALYDPFFSPKSSVLEQTYDFIVCCEVPEHFHNPAKEFARLDSLLRPGGWLGLMTCFRTEDHLFVRWHYRRDPTHVVFYKEATLRTVAGRFAWTIDFPRKDVAIMRKPLVPA